MIDLTPLDVRKKRDDFKRAMRGYDALQVDSFLDIVADRMEELVQSEARLSEQVSALREQLDVYRERDRALNDALVTAQELREDARVQAERSAEIKLREAESEAQNIARRAEAALEHSTVRLSELRSRRDQFLRSFSAMLDRFAEEIEVEMATLADERTRALEESGPVEGETAPEGDPAAEDGAEEPAWE